MNESNSELHLNVLGTLESSTNTTGDPEGPPDVLPPEQIASAFLPPSLFDLIEGSEDVGVLFTLYDSSNLFPVQEDKPNDTIVGSPIVGATVVGESFVNLEEPVIILLRLSTAEGQVSTLHML